MSLRKLSGARRLPPSTTPGAADDVELSVPAAQLARLRDRLRRASVAVLLFLVPAEGVLIAMQSTNRSDPIGHIGMVWDERLPLCLAVASLILLLALLLSRFLPHGREAAATSPWWGRPYRTGEPGRGTLFLLVAAVILVGIGSKASFDAYNGTLALTGGGDNIVLTIGENTHVTRTSPGKGHTNYFLEGPNGKDVLAEGGSGSAGERYAMEKESTDRAWHIGFTGWVNNVATWGVGLMFIVGAGLLVWWQVRCTRTHRRWLAGRALSPWTSGPARVAAVYATLAAVLAMSGSAIAFRAQIIESNRDTTMEVPALAQHGLPTTMAVSEGGTLGPAGTWRIDPQHSVHVQDWVHAKSSELRLGADVTRYATPDQALEAQQQFLTDAAKEGVRQRLADGTEIIIYTGEHGLDTEDAEVGPISTDVTASAVRGRLLVTLEVYARDGEPPAQVVTQTPLIRDVLADNAPRFDEVSYPWWY